MEKEVQVATYEGGHLTVYAPGEKGREAVLALPLSRLLVTMVRVPPDADAAETARPELKAMNPFPDDDLMIGCETVSESAAGRVVLAAALPESATEDFGEALDAAKLSIVRVDAIELGALRVLWEKIGGEGRRLILLEETDCTAAIVLDGDQPSALRAMSAGADFRREALLVLLAAERFGGVLPLREIVLVSGLRRAAEAAEGAEAKEGEVPPAAPTDPYAGLETLAPIRRVAVEDPEAALKGLAERGTEAESLDALPASWREVLAETRFKAKLTKYLAIFGGIWALVMGVLFGVPIVYGYMADYQKGLSKDHAKQFRAVSEMRDKTEIVKKYSDHARGALEIMKAVSDRLPEGIELSSWYYKRGEGVRVSGEAETANQIYDFKNAMAEMAAGEGEDADVIFKTVGLNGPSASKNGQKFDLDCRHAAEEEEAE